MLTFYSTPVQCVAIALQQDSKLPQLMLASLCAVYPAAYMRETAMHNMWGIWKVGTYVSAKYVGDWKVNLVFTSAKSQSASKIPHTASP